MRLLVATHSTAMLGGTESYLSKVLPLLAQGGLEVGLATEAQPCKEASLQTPAEQLTWTIRNAADAQALVAAWVPDVVMQNGMLDPSIESALLATIPSVLFAHNYYGTCVSGKKRFALPSLQVCHRRFGLACLGLYLPRRCGGLNPLTAIQQFTLQRKRLLMLERYAYVVVASQAMREEYLRHGVRANRLRVVPYFVEALADDGLRSDKNQRDRHGPLLMVSRLVPEKGAQELIEAAARAQSALGWPLELIFAGTGSIEPLRRLALRRGVAARFVGWVSASTRSQLMARAALLVVPSVWPEPFGIVGIEGGVQGLPAVAFATGGIVDWLADGESGIAAPGARPRVGEFAAALVRALEDEERYRTLCAGAFRVAARFTAREHVSRLVDALERAARER